MFEVHKYSIDNLVAILSAHTEASTQTVLNKSHTTFLDGYFGNIGAKTIVCETEYVDHDYLEDFIKYYVRCFQGYNRRCARLHFFRNTFEHASFNSLITSPENTENELTPKILQDNYLGFIVLKPLPRTIIGRTCLTIYPHDNRRYFPITREYSANLFGMELRVKHSLAYQEQDTVVAACATSALWSAFQGTGILFHHKIPSPSEITDSATETLTRNSRAFPSNGLDAIEMARAIKNVGLEPYHVAAGNEHITIGTIYAYLKAKIPIILGFWIVDDHQQFIGKHAVAVTGYSLNDAAHPKSLQGADFNLKATAIDKLYVHDDQVGPFSRMLNDGQSVRVNNGQLIKDVWSLSSGYGQPTIKNARAVPDLLLVPLNPKIRIPFSEIHDLAIEIDSLLKQIFVGRNIVWDIFASTINEIKTDIFNNSSVSAAERNRLLLQSMPKHIWKAQVTISDLIAFDLLFDATDIEQGDSFVACICYDKNTCDEVKQGFSDSLFDEEQFERFRSIIDWFRAI
ncbi:hypothetical protein [Methylophaga sp. OBS1]|uniref:hypothetical protein n=1 Tax=Methylophaga sp. OBS1 TaxID=2991933 RepID=UPI00225707D2|nr:hypothetical protein [Methylophaga sp. OBS1]MCX4192582.1 hypothetical protein [Methylophaga sp. OBS1]